MLQRFNQFVIIIGLHTGDSNLVIITEPNNKLLADHTTENEVGQLLSKYKHKSNIHERGKQ